MKKSLFTRFCIPVIALGLLFTACQDKVEPESDKPVVTTPALTPRTYATVGTFVGSTTGNIGSTDATGTAARFSFPRGMVQDTQGNLYVADMNNNTIRKITSAGVTSIFAGTLQVGGGTDGTGTAARFYQPHGLAIDASGNLYVSEFLGNRIRKITPAAVVTTVAGNGTLGSTDGTGTTATFSAPTGIALDNAGNLFVCDNSTARIRKIVLATGTVSTFAGGGTQATAPYDGQGTAARLFDLTGLCIDTQNNLYVTSYTAVVKISPTGLVTTVAGNRDTGGFLNGQGTTARFGSLYGICIDASGHLYASDRTYGAIRKITPAGVVSDFVGTTASMYPPNTAFPSPDGDADGSLTTARFRGLAHLYINTQGVIFVSEESRVRKIE